MCGIAALLVHEAAAENLAHITAALENVLNRGYDSVGLVSVLPTGKALRIRRAWEDEAAFVRWMRAINQHATDLQGARVFACHSRWATHGPKTEANSHPHVSANKQFFLCHNGIIQNYQDLKTSLPTVQYASLTDTEAVVQLVGAAAADAEDCFSAFQQSVLRCEGTWAFVLVNVREPNTLYVARRGSPLLIGYNATQLFVGSESSVFDSHCTHAIPLPEGMIARIRSVNNTFLLFDGTQEIPIAAYTPAARFVLARPQSRSFAPFSAWTEKEIHDQKSSLWEAMNRGARLFPRIHLGGLQSQQTTLSRVQHLIFVACGTSLNACRFVLSLYKKIHRFVSVQVLEASEFTADDLPRSERIGCVFVSQSGETHDCYKVLKFIKSHRPSAHCIGVVNVPSSLLARETDCGVYLNAGREVGVASTKSFTSQVVVLTLIALWFAQLQNSEIVAPYQEMLLQLHQKVPVFIPRLRQTAHDLVPVLRHVSTLLLLGKGCSHSAALEGALKIKELAYIHAEAFAGGALKHGPFALLSQGTPVFLHVWKGPHFKQMISACEEIQSRGGFVMALTNSKTMPACVNKVIYIDATTEYTCSLLSVIFYQWLAYLLSRAKAIDPDKPRNLAKSVTVE